jgi:hypothetical protein
MRCELGGASGLERSGECANDRRQGPVTNKRADFARNCGI